MFVYEECETRPVDAARIADAPAGPELFAALTEIPILPLGMGFEVEYLRGVERMESWLAARKLEVIAGIVDEADAELRASLIGAKILSAEEVVAAEIAGALRMSSRAALGEVNFAIALHRDFVATQRELSAGAISRRQASQIVDSLILVDDEIVRLTTEAKVLGTAPHQTVAQTKRSLRDQLIRIDTAKGGLLTQKAQESRSVSVWPSDFAMVGLDARLRADHAFQIMDELDRKARLAGPDDLRSMDARELTPCSHYAYPVPMGNSNLRVRLHPGARGSRLVLRRYG